MRAQRLGDHIVRRRALPERDLGGLGEEVSEQQRRRVVHAAGDAPEVHDEALGAARLHVLERTRQPGGVVGLHVERRERPDGQDGGAVVAELVREEVVGRARERGVALAQDRRPVVGRRAGEAERALGAVGRAHVEGELALGAVEERVDHVEPLGHALDARHLEQVQALGVVRAIGRGVGEERREYVGDGAAVEGEDLGPARQRAVGRRVARDDHAVADEAEGERHAVGSGVQVRREAVALVVHAHLGVPVPQRRDGLGHGEVELGQGDGLAVAADERTRAAGQPVRDREELGVGVVEAEARVQRLHRLAQDGEVVGDLALR